MALKQNYMYKEKLEIKKRVTVGRWVMQLRPTESELVSVVFGERER